MVEDIGEAVVAGDGAFSSFAPLRWLNFWKFGYIFAVCGAEGIGNIGDIQ